MENFEIITKLGEGAYSTVYKVKRKIDNQIYALKKVKLSNLTQKEKTNSLNEVRILASVKSKYVISYKEAFFDEKDSTLGIVMEFADNGDLYQKIVEHKKKKTYFEETEVWRIFIQLVKGLKSLHDLKILHRDLKSANVFLFKNGNAKLGDLNVSKVAKRGLGYTQTGTPYYASPEVWKDLPYDNKSDIWSLGCVLYEMITLHPPFRARSMEELYKRVLSGEISKLPSQFSTDLYEVVSNLIKVNSNNRPNCNDILNNKLVKKRIEYFNSMNNNNENDGENNMDEKEEQALLKTIHIPKNLLYLSNQLPKPNYNKKKINKSNTACELEINNLNKNIFPIINKAKSTLPNININQKNNNEDTKVSSDLNNNLSKNSNNENEINIINNSINANNNNNSSGINNQIDIKKEVQLYKKLYAINNRQIEPIKKYQNQENNIINYNNYNNYNNNYNRKIFKLYEPYNHISNSNSGLKLNLKKMPKYKIANSNSKRTNNSNKYNIYLKNREELYKGLYKNLGGGNGLPKIYNNNNNSCLNIGEKNGGNYQIKNNQSNNGQRNRLSPITKNLHYVIK
jgi:NIMA (never in mitosis gene a)-related kinase